MEIEMQHFASLPNEAAERLMDFGHDIRSPSGYDLDAGAV
jgi:hypothetical protein